MLSRLAWVLLAGVMPFVLAPAQAQQSAPAAAPAVQRIAIAIKGRKVDSAQQRIRVPHKDTVELAFTSDEKAELHLHGYDRLLTVELGATAVLRLDATIAGRFSLEAHSFGGGGERRGRRGHVVLLYLEVYPR
jgi:hypothetical protein